MAGYIFLEGGAEFGGQMADPDLRAITLAGGFNAPISVIPAAAAPDNNHQRAGHNALAWFKKLGAIDVTILPLIDRASANQPSIAKQLQSSRLIYLLGGFPHYLAQTISASLCWQAMLIAYRSGAIIGGSSAGAMVLCRYYFDPDRGRVYEGLNLLPNTCVIPHHNTFGKSWSTKLTSLLPTQVLIGIDEETGMIDDGINHETDPDLPRLDALWSIYGKGVVTLYRYGQISTNKPGTQFTILPH